MEGRILEAPARRPSEPICQATLLESWTAVAVPVCAVCAQLASALLPAAARATSTWRCVPCGLCGQ